MKRPCIDCGSLIRSGSRCRTCIRTRERNRDRPTSTQRGYDARWRSLSTRLTSHSPQCATCGLTWMVDEDGHPIPGNNPPTVDHIVPKAKGGTDVLDNLRVLCLRCNSGKRDRIA